MHRALAAFNQTIADARSMTTLFDFLTASVPSPFSYDDLLRIQLVYAVSAFDKLIHELVRIGMVNSFLGARTPTPKYKAETISIEFHLTLVSATLPPPVSLFEQEVARKLKILSFQDPKKVADALSYIWDEKDKWQKIGTTMGMNADDARTQLKLIVDRRNAIVHESDSDALSVLKQPLSKDECRNVTDFIESCGRAIYGLVI